MFNVFVLLLKFLISNCNLLTLKVVNGFCLSFQNELWCRRALKHHSFIHNLLPLYTQITFFRRSYTSDNSIHETAYLWSCNGRNVANVFDTAFGMSYSASNSDVRHSDILNFTVRKLEMEPYSTQVHHQWDELRQYWRFHGGRFIYIYISIDIYNTNACSIKMSTLNPTRQNCHLRFH